MSTENEARTFPQLRQLAALGPDEVQFIVRSRELIEQAAQALELIDQMVGDDHYVECGPDGWTLQSHPASCLPNLAECPINVALQARPADTFPAVHGRYLVTIDMNDHLDFYRQKAVQQQ